MKIGYQSVCASTITSKSELCSLVILEFLRGNNSDCVISLYLWELKLKVVQSLACVKRRFSSLVGSDVVPSYHLLVILVNWEP